MNDKKVRPRPKRVRPIFLIAMGIALAGFGLISGIALDLATRPVTSRAPAPAREVAAISPDQPTALRLERPVGSPVRAWAPETQEAKSVPVQRENAPMVAFAVAPPSGSPKAVIAVVIDDMGVDRGRSLKMMDLRGPLTLSLMTYADGLPDLATRARKAGHEVMAHLPMEPLDPAENPGRGALRVSMDAATIAATIAQDLDGWSGYVGINNHMGSKFTADRQRMDVVMRELKARGLLWLDSKTAPGSQGSAAARAAGVPYVERDVFIDNVQTEAAVLAQLAEAEKIARARGSAIAIGHPHDATLAALAKWLPEAASRGVTLVPLTEILRRRDGGVARGSS